MNDPSKTPEPTVVVGRFTMTATQFERIAESVRVILANQTAALDQFAMRTHPDPHVIDTPRGPVDLRTPWGRAIPAPEAAGADLAAHPPDPDPTPTPTPAEPTAGVFRSREDHP